MGWKASLLPAAVRTHFSKVHLTQPVFIHQVIKQRFDDPQLGMTHLGRDRMSGMMASRVVRKVGTLSV